MVSGFVAFLSQRQLWEKELCLVITGTVRGVLARLGNPALQTPCQGGVTLGKHSVSWDGLG